MERLDLVSCLVRATRGSVPATVSACLALALSLGCSVGAPDGGDGGDELDSIAATFGQQGVGAQWGVLGTGIKAANKFALDMTADLTRLTIYTDGKGAGAGTGLMRGVIYSVDA